MLESLLEMEIAYSMMKSKPGGEEDAAVHPVDLHYQKMGAEIEPLARDTDEYAILEKYVKNTHAATHSNYSLTVEEVSDRVIINLLNSEIHMNVIASQWIQFRFHENIST